MEDFGVEFGINGEAELQIIEKVCNLCITVAKLAKELLCPLTYNKW